MKTIIRTILLTTLLSLSFIVMAGVYPAVRYSHGGASGFLRDTFQAKIAEAVCYNPNNPGGYCDPSVVACGATHYTCDKGSSVKHADNPTNWTWTCRGYLAAEDCVEQKGGTVSVTPSAVRFGDPMTVNWNGSNYGYCKVSVCPASMWYREWVGLTGSSGYIASQTTGCGAPTFTLSCGANSASLITIATAAPTMMTDGSCGTTNNSCVAGTLSDVPDSATQYLWNCTGINGGATAACALDIPTNGKCGTTNNSCIAGTLSDVPDSSSQYLWNCNGAGGGTNAACVLDKPIDGFCGPALSCPPPSGLQTYIGGYCQSYTPYNCNKGNSVNQVSGPTGWTWTCASPNGGASDNCSRARPIDAVCSLAHYNCTTGLPYYGKFDVEGNVSNTPPTIWDTSSQWVWQCLGPNGGISQTCREDKPIDGSCAATHYACASGTSINGYDAGDRWLWDCAGGTGGSTAFGCTEMKPINGVCSSTHYSCAPGGGGSTANVSSPTKWTWVCNGVYGGLNASCTENKAPVDGVCGPNPAAPKHYSCLAGNPVNNFFDGAYHYSWNCNGSGGGANVSCAETVSPPPVNGVCAPIHFGCMAGTSIGGYDAGTSWNWNCAGTFGGATPACTEFKPFDGVCGAAHYTCAAGTSAANVDGAAKWTWVCSGGYGGSSINCGEDKPPVITWSPVSAPTIDYYSKVNYSYSATNAASCDLDEINASGSVVNNIWKNGPTSAPWSGPQGPYEKDVWRRLTCHGLSGKSAVSDYHIIVRQNDASCGMFSVPGYLLPGEHFTANAEMNNTGTNPWTNSFAANYVLSRGDLVWSSNSLKLTGGPVQSGMKGSFSENLIAPATEGDYDFSWQMRPIFGGSWWPTFGPLCGVITGNGNKIRVKNATLGITPESYQFSDTVLGDSPSTLKVHVQNLGGGMVTGVQLHNIVAPFSCTNNCNPNLPAGSSADITLAFAPMATGSAAQNAPITNTNSSPAAPIIDTISGLPVDHIYIYGIGVDKFTVSTDPAGLNTVSSIDLGDVAWTTTKFINLTIRNRSKEKSGLISPSVDMPSVFSCVSGCSAQTLNPGQSKAIRLKFLPPEKLERGYTGRFNIGASPDIHIGMSGRGVKPEFSTEEK